MGCWLGKDAVTASVDEEAGSAGLTGGRERLKRGVRLNCGAGVGVEAVGGGGKENAGPDVVEASIVDVCSCCWDGFLAGVFLLLPRNRRADGGACTAGLVWADIDISRDF